MKAYRLFLGVLLSATAFAGESLVVVAYLTDGSRVIGQPATSALTVELPVSGPMDIQWERIRRVERLPGSQAVSLHLMNHDQITASLPSARWTLHTLMGPCTIPGYAVRAAYCRPAGGREVDWEVLPILPADREGRPVPPPHSLTDSLVLEGWTVRSSRAFSRPITFDCTVQLTGESPRDALFALRFVPPGEPRDAAPQRLVAVLVGQRGGRQFIGWARNNTHPVTLYEGDGPFPRNRPHAVRVRWSDERLEISLEGRTFSTDEVRAWYDAFHLDLTTTAMGQRWIVSETVARSP